MNTVEKNHAEEGTVFSPDFEKIDRTAKINAGVIPAIIQHHQTKEVLMLGYMNRLALDETVRTGVITLWSTSRNELWVKGKTSGNTFSLVRFYVNCEQNSLLIACHPNNGGVCHTRSSNGKYRSTCYYREVIPPSALSFITE